MLHARKARQTNRIRTKCPLYQDSLAWRMAKKFTGASTNLQRCKLLSLTGLRSQISEAMSRAP
ncbi:MAG: hypothetical protein FJX56_03365 [Alphaproteobacteria bacterium]|nr:hypothetical protein [Alphaproteobacteria bacterium]